MSNMDWKAKIFQLLIMMSADDILKFLMEELNANARAELFLEAMAKDEDTLRFVKKGIQEWNL